jgi:hypothetical protein
MLDTRIVSIKNVIIKEAQTHDTYNNRDLTANCITIGVRQFFWWRFSVCLFDRSNPNLV